MAEVYHVRMRNLEDKDPDMWEWGPLHSEGLSKKKAQKFLRKMRKEAKEDGYTSEEFKLFKGEPPKRKFQSHTAIPLKPLLIMGASFLGMYWLMKKD